MTISSPGSKQTPGDKNGREERGTDTSNNEGGYFFLDKPLHSGEQMTSRTPSPKITRFADFNGLPSDNAGAATSNPASPYNGSGQSGSDSEWQDCDSDNEKPPGISSHTPSKLSNAMQAPVGNVTSTIDSTLAGSSASDSISPGTTTPQKQQQRKQRQGYRLQKPKSQKRRLRDRTNDSFNLFVPSSLKNTVSSNSSKNRETGDNSNTDEYETTEETPGTGSFVASKDGPAALRKRLKKIRSKSDTGVNTIPSNLFRKKKELSKSVDLRRGSLDDDNQDQQHHSDTEIHDNQQQENMMNHSSRSVNDPANGAGTNKFGESGENTKPKRKFYSRANTMGDLFAHINSGGPSGNTAGAGVAAGTGYGMDSSPGLFKRRISAFNTGDHSGTWKDLKKTVRAGLGMKRRGKPVPEIDYEKSTELINELIAGAPAAIVFASMFQRDEKNLKRIPVLLEQIKFKFTDTSPSVYEKNRKYRLDLEYGSGPARLTWTIHKEYKDFWMLHSRLKSMSFQGISFSVGKNKLPKFPTRHRAAAATQRAAHNQNQNNSHHSIHNQHASTSRRASGVETEASSVHNNGPTSLFSVSSRGSSSSRRSLSVFRQELTPSQSRAEESRERKAKICDELLKDMDKYFKLLLQQFRFRPDVNKIFQFLEISNMSIRLAPENSFHGKEGYLFVRSSSSLQGWRVSHWRPNDLAQMISRHTNKWFMVRHSYLVCVDNIYETNILEVFLVDSGFKLTERSAGEEEVEEEEGKLSAPNMHITLQLENLERKIKLVTGSDKNLKLWMDSINEMKEKTPWSKKQRFDSFAPVRKNVHAQWFVDGRDYFWAVSSAIDMAKDVIYIHDWWLSPEIYMRRPPEGNQEWRLDRLLKRKAEEGVKIFVIVYRNVGQTIPIDSMYTKHSLLDLHPNIYVMRSPNQLLQNTFFWAHHEKLCLIDHTVSFVGGIDLCFGRWDTPDHVLNDDAATPFYSQGGKSGVDPTQIWPGKDYSNPRVQDFYSLDHPYDDMYDREKVPRMPWHDVHMMLFGQPARDLVRHFVQRWNYLLRQKRPSRFTPLLLPPADFTEEQVKQMDLDGTCEVQVLRSSGSWSLGLREPEHSIQNAYLKAIEQSEHFVYIENQFFITSTTVDATKIENRIGDALVERIIRAHENGEDWRAVIVIPLMPGFESQVDQPDGSSVRVIMQCQYYSISRGPNSIFGRLEKANINPDDYIQFFSLRKWGKVGPTKKIVTEQLYIHAKTMIVDDRVAIIGSANINERSMRGHRDSECASIIRDAHQLESTMGGKPYKVAKFAHTLRVRLMREHLGLDVDQIDAIERQTEALVQAKSAQGSDMGAGRDMFEAPTTTISNVPTEGIEMRAFNHFAGIDNIGLRDKKNVSNDSRVQNNAKHRQDVEGNGYDGWAEFKNQNQAKGQQQQQQQQVPSNVKDEVDADLQTAQVMQEVLSEGAVEDLESFKRTVYEKTTSHHRPSTDSQASVLSPSLDSDEDEMAGLDDDFDPVSSTPSRVHVDPFAFRDPLDDSFYYDTWLKIAEKNTSTFREVFRCQPDDEVTTWREYKAYVRYGEAFSSSQDIAAGQWPHDELAAEEARRNTTMAHAPLGQMEDDDNDNENGTGTGARPGNGSPKRGNKGENGNSSDTETIRQPSSTRRTQSTPALRTSAPESKGEPSNSNAGSDSSPTDMKSHPIPTHASTFNLGGSSSATTGATNGTNGGVPRRTRARANTRFSSRRFGRTRNVPYEQREAEKILSKGIQGHLVLFPADWLARELETGNWFYNLDRIPPLEIYD